MAGDTNLARDVFVRDLRTGITTRVSQGKGTLQANGPSYSAAISGDGRYVAFGSDATNLVAGDTNSFTDVFVRANPMPTISGASPTVAARGASTTITVNGSHFLPGVSGYFGNDVTLQSVNRVSENQVVFTISVASIAVTGSRIVLVFNFGTGAGANAGASAAFNLRIT